MTPEWVVDVRFRGDALTCRFGLFRSQYEAILAVSLWQQGMPERWTDATVTVREERSS